MMDHKIPIGISLSEEMVYTIDVRRGDIVNACKSTFVSSSKKKYGRHIFWLSNKQHKSIRTTDCKPGCEFEIKTFKA